MTKFVLALLATLLPGACGTGKHLKSDQITLTVGNSYYFQGVTVTLEDYRHKWTLSGDSVAAVTLRLKSKADEGIVTCTFPSDDYIEDWKNIRMRIADGKRPETVEIGFTVKTP